MADLFILPDERALLARWDFHTSVFRIVAREYRRVLDGSVPADRHRLIVVQTVSDLLELQDDLARLGTPDPAAAFSGWVRAAWDAAVLWVCELRAWRIPPDSLPVAEIEAALERRQSLESRFTSALFDVADVDAPAVLHAPAAA